MGAAPRSSRWPKLSKAFLARHPVCAMCGGKRDVVAHHIKPFHLHPELELEESNLIPLCQDSGEAINCHLWFGHLGDFKRFNPTVVADVDAWREKRLAAIRELRARVK